MTGESLTPMTPVLRLNRRAMSKAAIIQPSLISQDVADNTIANAHALYAAVNTWYSQHMCGTKPQVTCSRRRVW